MVVAATNPWGTAKGLEPQRTDLWKLDFSAVFKGLLNTEEDESPQSYRAFGQDWQTHATGVDPMGGDASQARYYAISVALPELSVMPEVVKRDSRPYNVPGVDAPLGQIRVTFVHDSHATSGRSEILALLNLWRAAVRAGRGEMSSEPAFLLNKRFRVNYGFDVPIHFLGGLPLEVLSYMPKSSTSALQVVSAMIIKNMWLASFGPAGELNMSGSQASLINAVFYADDILTEKVTN